MGASDKDGSSVRPWWRRRAAGTVAVLLASAFLCCVQWRVLTYVCGNDPMLYIRAARVLLKPSLHGAEAVRHALTFVAPGYPVTLAAAIKLFGPLAPYWLNLAVLLASLPFAWAVLRRLMGSDRAALFAMLWAWVILLGGHELNAAYLLYPFREAPVLLCVYAAYACLLRGTRTGGRCAWFSAAGLLLIAACSFREPSVFLAVGVVLGLPWLAPTWRARARAGAWFLLPWLLLAAIAWIALHALGYAGSSQFEALRYLRDTKVALSRARKMLEWIPAEAGWIGVGCMALGIARAARRAPLLLAWFLVPAVLLFVFYAHMQMHVRYFLAAFLYAVVFAGYGLDGLLRLLEGWIGARVEKAGVGPHAPWRKLACSLAGRLPAAAAFACAVALVVLMVRIVVNARPWGIRVSAHEVREWRAMVKQLEPSADGRVRIAVEQRCRYLEDLLLSYTDADLLDPKQVNKWPAKWEPAYYFEPLNRSALYATPQWLMYLTLYAHRILENRMDLLPCGSGAPVIRTFGKGAYSQNMLRRWSAGTHQQSFASLPGRDQVLWLDWGACRDESPRTVTIGNALTGETWFTHAMQSNGLQAVFLPGQAVNGPAGLLTTVSSNPAPARPLFAVVDAAHAQPFNFGPERRVSLNRLLLGLDDKCMEEYPFWVKAGRPRVFRAPVAYSEAGGEWRVSFFGTAESRKALYLRCRHRDGEATVLDLTAAKGECSIDLASGETVELSLESEQAPARGSWFVERLSMEYRPARKQGE